MYVYFRLHKYYLYNSIYSAMQFHRFLTVKQELKYKVFNKPIIFIPFK